MNAGSTPADLMEKGIMKMMKRLLSAAMILAMAVAAGCASQNTTGSDQPGATQPQASLSAPENQADVEQAASKKTQYPLTIQDATGQKITFTKAPERIVSTSPSETEILFALGLGDKVVAVSDYDDYPEEAKSKPKIGGVRSPNAEAILAASPDLVVGGISLDDNSVRSLRDLKLTLYKVEPKKLSDIIENIRTIGMITDRQAEAEKLIAKMEADIKKVTEAVKHLKPEQKKKVYLEFSPGWTVGRGEFMHEMIELSGAINVAADLEGWNQVNEEKIIQSNPDVILYAKGVVDSKTNKSIEEMIRTRSGWDKIKAIVDNRVHGLDKDTLSRPGPRITEELVKMAKAIYPELVKS